MINKLLCTEMSSAPYKKIIDIILRKRTTFTHTKQGCWECEKNIVMFCVQEIT